MTEVIAWLAVPVFIMFFLIMLTERFFALFVQAARFVEGLNQ